MASTSINYSFVLKQIHKYNKARRQTLKDAALAAVGIHVGLLAKSKAIARELTQEERQRVIYFLRQFCVSQGVKVEIKE